MCVYIGYDLCCLGAGTVPVFDTDTDLSLSYTFENYDLFSLIIDKYSEILFFKKNIEILYFFMNNKIEILEAHTRVFKK
jgi:hypothetical protein